MKVLLVVDVQNDFFPGGALAARVPDGFVARINSLISSYVKDGDSVVYTRDWHPYDHLSFVDRGGRWPRHCVQGTPGAEFAPGLQVKGPVFSKAADRDFEEYSAASKPETPLVRHLRQIGATDITIVGIATEFCVLDVAKDLRGLAEQGDNWRVRVFIGGIAAVNPGSEECSLAIRKMAEAGVELVESPGDGGL